jgi:microcompartment protein CcmK/EutM
LVERELECVNMWFSEYLGVGHPCVSPEVVSQVCGDAIEAGFSQVIITAKCFLNSAYDVARRIEDDANSPISDVILQIIDEI